GFRMPQAGESRYATVERRGAEVVARALAWLQRPGRGPFFLWVELNDAQAPYQPPPGYARAGSAYNGEIRYADAQAGRFLAALRSRKLYDGALIVLAGDHGESLGAHGEETHGVFLYDDTIRVPLLVKLPQNKPGKAAAHVRLVDVAATVLQTAGLPVPPQMQGQSLLRAMRQAGSGEAAYARADLPHNGFGWSRLESWRMGKYLYIRAPKPELYDLETDPAAAHNLAAASQATAGTMATQLLAFDGRMAGKTSGSAQLSSSELQKLASLGYVGLQKPVAASDTAVSGTDPKDEIALATKVESALQEIEDGRAQKADSALQAVVKSHPGMFLAQFAAGLAKVQQRQYAAAVPFLRKAIELQPQAAWAYYEMGEALVHTGDWKGAATHLEIAVARLPKMAEAHAGLAEAYQHQGRGADAGREQEKAQQLRQ
ncbi:MAG TPA: sulfatase-like hydrolase/transferase, partial [Terriglobales bacterium]|nr:sulfatase-like hydrolase/transferase [Terriglobales bacterium]